MASANVKVITQEEVERMAAVNNHMQQAVANAGSASPGNATAASAATTAPMKVYIYMLRMTSIFFSNLFCLFIKKGND